LSDLEKVTKQARAMVTIYGLNEELGNITYYDSQGQSEYMQKPYSENTAEIIDKEISKIIEGQYQRAIELLENNREKLDQLAQLLLDKEVIFKDNVKEIFGARPWDKDDEIEEVAVEVAATEEDPKEESTPEATTAEVNAEANETEVTAEDSTEKSEE